MMSLNKPPKSRRGQVATARLSGRTLGILIAICGVVAGLVWIVAELPLVPAVVFVVFSTLVAGTVKGHFEAEAAKIEDEERNANKDWQFNRLVESKVQAIDRATQFEHERSRREEERKAVQEERERQRQERKAWEAEWADAVIRTKVKVRELLERHGIHPNEIVVSRSRRVFIHHEDVIPIDILRLIESKVEMAANYIKVHLCPHCNEALEASHADAATCPFCKKPITAKPTAQASNKPETAFNPQPEPELHPETQHIKPAKSRRVSHQRKLKEKLPKPPLEVQPDVLPTRSATMNETVTAPSMSIVQPVQPPIQNFTKSAPASKTERNGPAVTKVLGLEVGSKVTVETGSWKGFVGTVHHIDKKKRSVSIQFNNFRASVPINFVLPSPSESENKPEETLEMR